MSQDLNPVKPTVSLDGEEIVFESLVLTQGMNSCHHFDVVREFMSQDEMWKESPQKLLGYVGSQVIIKFSHMDSKHPYEFSGWVTDVRVDAWESEPDYDYINHKSNRVHIIGEGDIIQLNGARGMDSFVDCQLSSIVTQSVSKSGIGLECSPKFDGTIPYVMRYHETIFEFLNRLSSTYNELFFYDGKKIHFGNPGNCGEESLVFEEDVYSLRSHASAMPRKISGYEYFVENDKGECINAKNGSGSGLLSGILKNANRIFEENELLPCSSPVSDKGYLQKILDAKSTARDGAMLTIEGETRTCRVKLGCIVDISFPGSMGVSALGRYRVIEIVHKVDKNGNYSNHFVATPENMEYVTQQYLDVVKAYPEVAYVKSNADPKNLGRVQIQFEWQKRMGKESNWIRVQSPDAGGSGMTNRGMVFVPEEGDQVMVGFEFGDPNRPYVMGSLFGGKTGAGGGDGNNIHSIVTKSGHQLVFNDDQSGSWGITIADNNGNTINLSSSQKTIVISSLENIILQSKNIKLEADENITQKSGKDFDVSVGNNYSFSVEKDATSTIKGNSEEEVKGNYSNETGGKSEVSISKDSNYTVSGKMKVKVDSDTSMDIGGKLKCESSGDGKLNSKGKMYVTGGGSVYVGK